MRSKQTNWLDECLNRLDEVRVGVFGDFCIDAYWLIDEDQSELSVETALPVRRVRQQRYSLGGTANVTANLVALGVKKIYAVGLIGDDLHGELMLSKFASLGVDIQGMLRCQAGWQTFVYGKPCIGDVEQNRIDFGGFNEPSAASIEALADQFDNVADKCDIVILNQQIPTGLSTPEMIEKLNVVVSKHPECKFIVDSRLRAKLYKGAILKVNA